MNEIEQLVDQEQEVFNENESEEGDTVSSSFPNVKLRKTVVPKVCFCYHTV